MISFPVVALAAAAIFAIVLGLLSIEDALLRRRDRARAPDRPNSPAPSCRPNEVAPGERSPARR